MEKIKLTAFEVKQIWQTEAPEIPYHWKMTAQEKTNFLNKVCGKNIELIEE